MLRDQRVRGRQAILDVIRRSGRIARIDIAGSTGISQATVTTVTAELLKEGLIEEVVREPASGGTRRGRPRVDLKLRGPAHMVAGVKIANQSITVAIVDFEGELLGDFEMPLAQSTWSAEGLALQMRTALTNAAKGISRTLTDISAVGVGMAGFVDAEHGFIHWSPSLEHRNVAFAKVLQTEIDKPVFIDNDTNLVALAELYFGLGRDARDFLVVTIESGVGMGIVLNGEVYHGERGCGAEFGHTKVHLDGALCRCGQRGCLEAYVADYALTREASVGGLLPSDIPGENAVEFVVNAAKEGNTLAKSIVDRAGRMFAMGLANLVNIFDPELIILAGVRMQVDHLYANEVIDSIRNSIVEVDAPPPNIVIHKWSDLMWARGACAFALQEVEAMSVREFGESVA
ncbi:MAG: ROK family protein [Ruegeria sp.]|uniref:ROK family protein n=1 Tax=Ruegeria sp. TaxID=1879320 RepID=UPI00349EA75C